MEFHTSLDEIIDTLKKLKSAVPAGLHHQDIVKQDIVTVTIETNFRQGDLETKVDCTKVRCHRDGDGEQRGLVRVGGGSNC